MRTSIGIVLLLSSVVACTTHETRIISKDPNAKSPGGGDPTSETDGTDPDGTAAADPQQTPLSPLVEGLTISEIAVFQGVKVSVVKSGSAITGTKRNAPIVANRPALVRVYVAPDMGWASKSVTAELRLVSESATTQTPIARDTKTISKTSTDQDANSTFNFEVDAASLPADVTFQVALTAEDGVDPSTESEARFPQDGTYASLGAKVSGTVRVVVVPVKYQADGSGRTPDVSQAQLDRYKQTMMARYPAANVEVTARAPWAWNSTIGANGTGFSQVLSAITQLRQQDGVSDDTYYYGALAPAASFSKFCSSGCVAGLSTVVDDVETAYLRASVGVGYTGDDSASTMAHEVGHAHGREHAPCGGAQGVDSGFPYAGGKIGVWGYDILEKTFHNPSSGTDMMGYCENVWVSDYTYSALFDRVSAVAKSVGQTTSGKLPSGASANANANVNVNAPAKMRVATVAEDGSLSWGGEISAVRAPSGGELRSVAFLGDAGEEVGTETAHFYPYDHLPGGVLVMPRDPSAKANLAAVKNWSAVRIQGIAQKLAR
ncbi:M66 family metalloprotease [Labilithrix luteola]|nr:M66 family metalloprotease [Labilithrix luteola]